MDGTTIELLTAIAAAAAVVEAIATCGMAVIAFLTVVIVAPQVRQVFGSIAALEVEGLKYAVDQLHDPEFMAWTERLEEEWKKGNAEYPQHLQPEITAVLGRLDYIATLVERGYVSRDLLFYVFGLRFSSIHAFLTNFRTKEHQKLEGLMASYPKGFRLLADGAKWFSKESQRAFARMD